MMAGLQALHEERFLLIVKVTHTQHGQTSTPRNPQVPVIESTTLVLVSLTCSSLRDDGDSSSFLES